MVSAQPMMILPTDVLVIVFGCLSLRARLNVLSFVCKSWRSAVLRSITSLALSREGDEITNSLLAKLPSLTDLSIFAAGAHLLCVPGTVTTLRLQEDRVPPWKATDNAPSFVSQLTSIVLESSMGFGDRLGIVREAAPTLTSLRFKSLRNSSSIWLESLSRVSFPELRSLHIDEAEQAGHILDTFYRYHSQLAELSLIIPGPLSFSRVFPLVETLALHYKVPVQGRALARALAAFPSLTSLSLSGCRFTDLHIACNAIGKSLTKLKWYPGNPETAEECCLQDLHLHCRRLRSLGLELNHFAILRTLLDLSWTRVLTCLAISEGITREQLTLALSCCVSLRQLVVRNVRASTLHPLPEIASRHLRKVYCYMCENGWIFSRTILFWRHLLQRSNTITAVLVSIDVSDSEDRKQLIDLLSFMAQRGVQHVYLQGNEYNFGSSAVEALRLIPALAGWLSLQQQL